MLASRTLPNPSIEADAEHARIRLGGAWLTAQLATLDLQRSCGDWPVGSRVAVDGSGLAAIDTGGAWYLRTLLERLRGRGLEVQLSGLRDEYAALYALVDSRATQAASLPAPPPPGPLERLGRATCAGAREGWDLLAFIGETCSAFGRALLAPRRLRWRQLFAEMQSAGVDALPIIGLLSFLIGIVIAYQGGVQLRSYGANIFVVELVSLTILRELAPVMTAVIVAGRTGSAYTAQIGTMRVNEEIDALRTMGIPPIDLLVLPKLAGLMLSLPLLTMFSDILGVLGGMTMSAVMLDVEMGEFARRIPEAVSVTSFMIGIGKAPVFALLIATVGCFQGFRVSGGADSVGRQTTVSVVQGIFLVIVADALFSVIFSWLGI